MYALKKEMLWHVGTLAAKYTNVGLVDVRSMWTIIELAPLDEGIDEKQENLNALTECLRKYGYTELAGKVDKRNHEAREVIKQYLDVLPRCVYQGDLNDGNILVDEEKHFKGIIDFNMFGTEVNVNCFLNETMYYQEEQDYEAFSAEQIFDKMNRIQQELLQEIFKYYELNEVEKQVWNAYKTVIDLSFCYNVYLWISLIEQNKYVDKVIRLIELIVK